MSSAVLNATIRALGKSQRLTFCLLLAERMVPNLELYAAANEQPAGPARGALEALWALALGERKSVGEQWGEKLDSYLDSLDDDDNLGAVVSRNATLAVRCCLDLALEGDMECALMVSRISRDDVRQFLQAQHDEPLNLREQPLMQDEFAVQEALLTALAELNDATAWRELRQELRAEAVTNLGISSR
jgi:uncharacterized protein